MDRDELRGKFTELLTVEDQAQRSTMLNDMRSEVEKTFTELDNLKTLNESLVDKNTALTEANSKLFMQIEKPKNDKPQHKGLDLRGLGV